MASKVLNMQQRIACYQEDASLLRLPLFRKRRVELGLGQVSGLLAAFGSSWSLLCVKNDADNVNAGQSISDPGLTPQHAVEPTQRILFMILLLRGFVIRHAPIVVKHWTYPG